VAALLGSDVAPTGANVTVSNAMRVSAVYACVRVISESVASLPLILYRRQGRARRRADEHPLYAILHDEPNPLMTSLEFRELLQSYLLLYGNAYAEIQYEAGKVTALWPLAPSQMEAVTAENGEATYSYRLPDGKLVTLPGWRVFHLRGLGSDGLIGHSPISMARNAIGMSMATETYGAKWFANGARPGVILRHPSRLSNEAAMRLRESWNASHSGLDNAQRTAVLEEGMDITTEGVPPEDSQFLETRKFQVAEIARMYRVPLHMIGDLDRSTNNNIEHQGIEFVVYTLRPWLVRWEQAIRSRLMSSSEQKKFYAEHIIEGLMRGDTQSRYAAYSVGRQNGWLSANDVRELENMNPIEGGDDYWQPLNMGVMGEEKEAPEPAPEPVNEAENGQKTAQNGENGEKVTKTSNSEPKRDAGGATIEKSLLADHFRPILRDVCQRLVNRECNDIQNAAKRLADRPDDYVAWFESFRSDHREVVRQYIKPVVDGFAGLAGLDAGPLVDEIAETWVSELSPDTALLPWRRDTWSNLVAEDVLAGDGG
jgi:HK97 family phage portal protein